MLLKPADTNPEEASALGGAIQVGEGWGARAGFDLNVDLALTCCHTGSAVVSVSEPFPRGCEPPGGGASPHCLHGFCHQAHR